MQRNRNRDMSYSVIISTCDKFSDLWEAQVLLLNQNWTDRPACTLLVTDKPTERKLDGVEIVAAGEGTEITERLNLALKQVKTPYVLFTLDDYFLIEKIDGTKIDRDMEIMEAEKMDYMRLHWEGRKRQHQVKLTPTSYGGIYLRDPNIGDYAISLYPGIWRTDFMRATTSEKLNAWQYEVALTRIAREMNAKCAISKNNEFPFLDVIRKGKLLRKADRYFKENPIYHSGREVMRAKDEWMLTFRTFLRIWLPAPLFKLAKRIMRKRGYTFFSDAQ